LPPPVSPPLSLQEQRSADAKKVATSAATSKGFKHKMEPEKRKADDDDDDSG
jgi:hypothetical protein